MTEVCPCLQFSALVFNAAVTDSCLQVVNICGMETLLNPFSWSLFNAENVLLVILSWASYFHFAIIGLDRLDRPPTICRSNMAESLEFCSARDRAANLFRGGSFISWLVESKPWNMSILYGTFVYHYRLSTISELFLEPGMDLKIWFWKLLGNCFGNCLETAYD